MSHHAGGVSREIKAQTWLLASTKDTFAFFLFQNTSMFAEQVQDLSMTNLLSISASFETSDARDKILALVGPLLKGSSERQGFKPNYSLNARSLHIRTAKHFLHTTQKLDVATARPWRPDY
jgi:hypothetical protein